MYSNFLLYQKTTELPATVQSICINVNCFRFRKSFRFNVLFFLMCLFALTGHPQVIDIRESVHWPNDGDRILMSEYHHHRCCGDSAIWDFSDARPTTRSHYVQWFNFGDSALVKVVGDKMQCRAFIACHEVLGHGRAFEITSLRNKNPQQEPVIQFNNLMLRLLDAGWIDNGAQHGNGAIVKKPSLLPILLF